MKPKLFYTIWFSQRNGSSLLCEGLKSTGIAGVPEEFFHLPANTSLLDHYQASDYQSLQASIWEAGSTSNGVFGVKVNAPAKENDPRILELHQLSGQPASAAGNFQVWNHFFPEFKHIFITRRNKIRQAVSWWKAIVSQNWHSKAGEAKPYDPADIRDRYDFDAIRHLLIETTLRDARIQDMLEQAGAIPLTIVYEDFILQYEATIREVVRFLGIEQEGFEVKPPFYERLADELSDEWTERFRKELQADWDHVIW